MFALASKFLVFNVLMLAGGCAKLEYLIDQGQGQLKILVNARPNEEVLADPSVTAGQKEKIRRIGEYHRFFYNYWQAPPSRIYQKTTLLGQEAVSFLVVVSPKNMVVAENFSFPLVGKFPYLGFFAKESAEKFQKRQAQLGKSVWVRPVYAYSTLGYFNDPILSSFFDYNDFALAELIFHELMHTIFFIKGEVDFNEALASYFSQSLVEEYFAQQKDAFLSYQKQMRNNQKLQQLIAQLVPALSARYIQEQCQQTATCEQILQTFLEQIFRPQIGEACQKWAVTRCWPLERTWNNAAFAALMTYEEQTPFLGQLQRKLQLDLRSFLDFIRQQYAHYRQQNSDMTFSQYLLTMEET